MSGGTTIGFVDFADFFFESDRVVALPQGRFWCETGAVARARADEPGLTSVSSPSQALLAMIIKRTEYSFQR